MFVFLFLICGTILINKKLFVIVCFLCGVVSDVQKLSMLGALTPVEESALPIRFCGVQGYDGRRNDVIYCHPVLPTEKQSTVVFFGGDMQVKKVLNAASH